MTIRSGMTELIRLIRQLAQAEDGEYEVAGETYWQDEHLQDVLDVFRTDVYEESIYPVPQFISGATVYQNYYWANPNVERADSGTAIWQLRNMNGEAIGTANYSVDYPARRIRFGTPTDGSWCALNYSVYDINRAAAEVWRRKAANVANRFDIKTDNHDLKRNQLRQNYLDMAKYYEGLAQQGSGNGGSSAGRMKEMVRSDLNG